MTRVTHRSFSRAAACFLLPLFVWLLATKAGHAQEKPAAAPPAAAEGTPAANAASPARAAATPPPAGYRLAVGDSVQLSVFNEPSLEAQRTITSAGEVSFYLIGNVKIAGKSVGDAEEMIRELYDRDYLVNPKVTLTVTGYAAQFATVTGAVSKPGSVAVPVEGRFDLLDAIAAAGGATEKADLRLVTLRRKGSTETVRINAAALQNDPAGAPVIRPGDGISIGLRVDQFINVVGEVNRPGQIRFPTDEKLDVITAITMAGDFSRFAKTSDITIMRAGRVIPVDGAAISRGEAPTVQLQPGDTVKVGRRRI